MNKNVSLLVVTLGCFGSWGLHADVKLPAIFGDHMVLQQEEMLPVWGTADAGEKVTVTVGNENATTTADANGKWKVTLPPLPNGTPPVTMTVAGKNTVTFRDVLFGDVWVCTGQSNMEFRFSQAHSASTERPKANDTQLRLFHVLTKLRLAPHDDLTGSWEVCSPQSVSQFTAVGYFFGKDLRSALKRPIGLVESCCGGTSAQAWTSISALQANPALHNHVDEFNHFAANFPGGDTEFVDRQEAYQKWQQQVHDDQVYQAALKAWNIASAQAKASGSPIPARPAPPGTAPALPYISGHIPTIWFNGTIAPIIPYAIKGIIWSQGEGNTGSADAALEYRTLLPTLITDWRTRWGEGDFPFLFVQLAGFEDREPDWPLLRESQLKTLSVAKTGMAVAVDIGDPKNIHPTDKVDVSHRLALAAEHVAYGQDVVYSGPIYDSMKTERNTLRVSFTQTGGGLVIGAAPGLAVGVTPLPSDKLAGFLIAGEDKNWVEADAKIDGTTVVVSSPQVAQPVAVRYGWADAPRVNLYNKESLPASPFRTDEWDDHPQPPLK